MFSVICITKLMLLGNVCLQIEQINPFLWGTQHFMQEKLNGAGNLR
jgi:hypothetical protein